MKGKMRLLRKTVNGETQFRVECQRHRKPVVMRGLGPQGGLGTYNGVMKQAAAHRREHQAKDALRADRK